MRGLPSDPSRPDSKRERIVHGVILLLPAAALLLLRDQIAWIASYPASWTLPIARVIDRAMGWLIESCDFGLFTFRELTRAIAWLPAWPLKWMESLLVTGFADGIVGPLPWISVVVLAILVGHYVHGWRMALLAGSCTSYLAVFGQWDSAMRTMATVLVCVSIAALAGLAVGVAASRARWLKRIVLPLMDLMQSTPHYAYFVPIVFFFGIGLAAGAIATIIFAVPPMVRCMFMLVEVGVCFSPGQAERDDAGGATTKRVDAKTKLMQATLKRETYGIEGRTGGVRRRPRYSRRSPTPRLRVSTHWPGPSPKGGFTTWSSAPSRPCSSMSWVERATAPCPVRSGCRLGRCLRAFEIATCPPRGHRATASCPLQGPARSTRAPCSSPHTSQPALWSAASSCAWTGC